MKVYFGWNSQFCGACHDIAYVPNDATDAYIEDMFEEVLGVPYNEDCYYKKLDEINYEISESELLYLLTFKVYMEEMYEYNDLSEIIENFEDEAKKLMENDYRKKIIA